MSQSARNWFRENGYDDVVELIDQVMASWKNNGSKERRNWWDVLAGTRKGQPRIVAGQTFPILRVARERKGWPPVPGMIEKKDTEMAPAPRLTDRWNHD